MRRLARQPGLLGALLLGAGGTVAGTSLQGAMHGPLLWTASVIGSAAAVLAWILAARFRLVAFEWLTLALGILLVLGGPAVGLAPTPGAYLDFFDGIIGGWADLLSSVPPTPAQGRLVALPYLLSWLSTMAGLMLFRRLRLPAIAITGPLVGFGAGLLFSSDLTRVAVVQAGLLLALTLALGRHDLVALNLEQDRMLGNTTIARRRSRLLQAGLVMAASAVAAVALAPFIPGPDDDARLTLRDQLDPPWQPLDEPSPLAQIKSNFTDDAKDQVVFVARGDDIPARWALATLAAYDGTVWTVGDTALDGLAPFVPIDGLAPATEGAPASAGERRLDVDVEVMALDGPWLPMPGRLVEIAPSAANADASTDPSTGEVADADAEIDIRFNTRTGTVAVPTGANRLRYTATVEPWPAVPQSLLAELTFPEPASVGLDNQAASVRDWSADVVEGVDRGWDQIGAIRDELARGGYLADDRVLPGHSWARLADFFSQDEFYGNEEQYAAVAAIAARNAGLPARVVVGYLVEAEKLTEPEVAVTRGEASAWIEVLTTDHGWLPVDVTPPRDNEPTLAEEGTRLESVAAPNPPPPPPPPPLVEAETPDEELDDERAEDDDASAGSRAWVVGVAIGAGAALTVPAVAFSTWLAAMVFLKRRRRNRRASGQPEHQVVGAWYELSDRLIEAGLEQPPNLSLREQAAGFGPALGDGVESARLAALVDRAAFSPLGVHSGDAAQAWSDCSALVQRLDVDAPLPTRVMRLANPRALLERKPVG